jgi:adenine-specific DNA-methyltransferase
VPIIQFKGKTAVESYHRVVPHHTLEIDAKLSLAKKPSLDGNLIIEGDNLVALKSLLPTHAGKIKCIYIDPPYNTGNEGWIYNDNLTQPQFKEWIGNTVGKEGEDATRHDKWCCMMYPRLQLLKELLSDDGAIFVSIDDNEVHHLRMLMDEIFGPENFVAQVAVLCNPKGRVMSESFAQTHEHLVVYSKTISARDFSVEKSAAQIEKEYDLEDKDGSYRLLELRNTHRQFGKHNRRNLYYPLFINQNTGEVSVNKQAGWTEVLPDWEDGFEGCWTWGSEKSKREASLLFGKKTGRSWKVFRKSYANDPRKKPTTVWLEKEVQTEKGQSLLDEILGGRIFYAPKAVGLLEKIVEAATEDEDIILDSFAGSGTTAHAVLELNKQDGGNRKFILVQQPFDTKENEKEKFNICEKITAERVRRVSKGYSYKTQAGKTEKVEGLGGEFAYVRVGEKLMGEYRDLGTKLPAFEEVARYVYFTETSQNFDAAGVDQATGKIGEWKGTSYYLLYSPNRKEDRALDVEFLKNLKDKNPRKVIYCEKIWVHREDLSKFGDIRPMLVPFNLK